MLIISIGHGRPSDPFTYTCVCEDDAFDPLNKVELLTFIYKEHSVLPSTLDKVLVVQNNEFIAEYDHEDGLGNDDEDLNLELF